MKKIRKIIFVVLLLTIELSAASPPALRSKNEIEKVLSRAPKVNISKLRKLNIVLVADVKDHGKSEHDYPLWQKRWQLLIGGREQAGSCERQVNLYGPGPAGCDKEIFAGAPDVNVTTARLWPSKEQLQTADLIVMHCYARWTGKKIHDLKEYLSRGGGFVMVHPAVIIPNGMKVVDELTELTGLAWEYGYTGYRHGPMELKIAAKGHPICLGLPDTIRFVDEAYWPLRGDKNKINILAVSDEKISTDSKEKKPEPMFWTSQFGKGRVFGCILGHYTWTFDDPYFRILLLRGMAWAAGQSPFRFDPLVLRGIPLETQTQ